MSVYILLGLVAVAAVVLVLVGSVLWLAFQSGRRSDSDDTPPAGVVADSGLSRLEGKVRGQRLALGCVFAVLLAVILGVAALLIVGFQVLDFLRDLGRGHPE